MYVKLIKWAEEHKAWVGIMAIVLFLFPILVVHSLFKIIAPCDWFIANWTAGDVLVYCGEVFGAVATIVAIIFTIVFTQENQKVERKLSIKPHLQTEDRRIYNSDILMGLVANRALFVIYPLDESEIIGSSYELPYFLKESEMKNPQREILKTLDFLRNNYIIQYTISNAGAGNALNISFTIDGTPVIPPFSLAVNDTKVFVIILKEELLKDIRRSIRLKHVFQDVASIAKYEQHETITLFKEDNGTLNSSQHLNDVLSQPKEI